MGDQQLLERLYDMATTRMQPKRERKMGVGTKRRKEPGMELKRARKKQMVLMNKFRIRKLQKEEIEKQKQKQSKSK